MRLSVAARITDEAVMYREVGLGTDEEGGKDVFPVNEEVEGEADGAVGAVFEGNDAIGGGMRLN